MYLLGLCMLEAALLIDLPPSLSAEEVEEMLAEVEERYSSEMAHVLGYMLA